MKNIIAVVTAVLLLAACGEGDNNDHDSEENHEHNAEVSPAADACEHAAEGPSETADAAAVGEDGPSLSTSHTRYDITLPGNPPEGDVTFEAAEDDEAHFFFTADVDLTVTDAGGTVLDPAETIATVDECDEVVEGLAYELGVGSYVLTISAAETDVSMVYVPGGEEGHEHE